MGGRVKNAEIAFFGGSFTAIDRDYMISLLEVAHEAVEKYGFIGVRCSTRPDKIDSEVLTILKKYSVTSIELGAQSMDDRVLFMNDRGHTSDHVRKASALIKSFGFQLGLQMMTGLYGSDRDDDFRTACELRDLKPDTVRIYPTITLENTKLADLYRVGEYVPPTLEDTVELCSELIPLFENSGITVIRVGLHATEEVGTKRVAGPFHPAFRELCMSRMILKDIIRKLPENSRNVLVSVPARQLSAAIGQKRSNLTCLEKMGYTVRIKGDDSVEEVTVSDNC